MVNILESVNCKDISEYALEDLEDLSIFLHDYLFDMEQANLSFNLYSTNKTLLSHLKSWLLTVSADEVYEVRITDNIWILHFYDIRSNIIITDRDLISILEEVQEHMGYEETQHCSTDYGLDSNTNPQELDYS